MRGCDAAPTGRRTAACARWTRCVRISGKTGTLPTIRNEVGVIDYGDGGRFAVAVFTRAADARSQAPERDAFIGYAAARAVEALRGQR